LKSGLEAGLREASSKQSKTWATIHSLGSHFKKIHDQWKKDKGISDEEVDKLVNSKVHVDGGCPPQATAIVSRWLLWRKVAAMRICLACS
jgi:hypothetical protein